MPPSPAPSQASAATAPCSASTSAHAGSASRSAVPSATARALAVVDVHANGPDWSEIDRLRKEWRPDGLVVGDPMTLDGGDQPIRQRAHAFARELAARYGVPVVLVDERASSIEAAQRFAADRAQGRRRRRDAAALDAIAAAVIVERWLAAPQDAIPVASLPA